jgi:hypothetical protein
MFHEQELAINIKNALYFFDVGIIGSLSCAGQFQNLL